MPFNSESQEVLILWIYKCNIGYCVTTVDQNLAGIRLPGLTLAQSWRDCQVWVVQEISIGRKSHAQQ